MMKARKQENAIFKMLIKQTKSLLKILKPVNISFKNKNNIKIFSDTGKLREFVSNRPALKEILKKVL